MVEQIGAINEVDERHVATISRYRTSSDGVIPSRYVELVLDNGGIIEWGFHFYLLCKSCWDKVVEFIEGEADEDNS